MDEVAFLSIMALMLILASIASILFRKLRLPAIIGYLAAGIIITNVWGVPDGISETVIKLLSSIGLVLLMFAIGMELNIKRLKQSGGFTIMVAAIQLPLVVLSGYIAGSLIGLNTVESLFLGAIISGSSTAVCTIVLRANKTISKDTADTIILVTVMDDIGQVIILTLLSPLLVGDTLYSVAFFPNHVTFPSSCGGHAHGIGNGLAHDRNRCIHGRRDCFGTFGGSEIPGLGQ